MPRSSWSLVVVSLTSVLLSTGCALSVKAGNPRPNVDLPESQASLALDLDPAIRDAFKAPSGDSLPPSDVQAWRTTLERGFQNSFRSVFKAEGGSALVLKIVEADLMLAATAVDDGGVAAAEAQVRYKARLVDAQGNVVRRSVGTVVSKRSATSRAGVTPVVESAVESMYEKIAQDLFSEAPVSASAQ